MDVQILQNNNHKFRSRCSIARTLEIFGDKWTLLIVRDLMWHNKHTFKDLQESDERIPTNILSQRLKRLEAWDILTRKAYQEKPTRYAYHLTATGLTLEPVLLQIMGWGHGHLGGGTFSPKADKNNVS